MRRSRNRPDRSWPSWRYGPFGEAEIFQSEVDVPYGWTKKPGETFVPTPSTTLDRDSILAELAEHGYVPHPAMGTAHLKKVLDGLSSPR